MTGRAMTDRDMIEQAARKESYEDSGIVGEHEARVSSAISLKRIADALERLAECESNGWLLTHGPLAE